jgi:hypothetical protein
VSEKTESIHIIIRNLTKPQALAIEEMLAWWQRLGSWGSSRNVTFFADGDGNFRPQITVDGRKPEFKGSELCGEKTFRPKDGGDINIDFDPIAWALRA